MGTYPMKVLIDEHNNEFVPWVSADCIHTNDGLSFEEKFATKIDSSNLKEGKGITITKDGADCTFDVDFGASDNIIDNLDTTVAGQGPLDARQGNILKNMIPTVVDNLTTADPNKVLSANQGVELKKIAVPEGGSAGQVLKKASDDDHSLEWGDAADPNAIVGDGSIMKIVELTYAEYKTLESNGELQDDTEYHINDMSTISGVGAKASQVEMTDGTDVESNIKALQQNTTPSKLVDLIYPIGSFYMSMNETDPSLLFGGTWVHVGGRFLLGATMSSDTGLDTYGYIKSSAGYWYHFNLAGERINLNGTGVTWGEVNHTLTIDEMPSHVHDGVRRAAIGNEGGLSMGTSSGSANTDYLTNATGGGLAHNNMPPYFTVHMWYRTA